jgi:glycosyltransferase involved in cell wall biosynthesis
MKVIILFSESLHYGLAASNRVLAYAKGLQESGAEVEILMPFAFVKNNIMPFEQRGHFHGVNYKYLCFTNFNPFEKYPKGISHALAISKIYLSYIYLFIYLIKHKKKCDVLFIYYFNNYFTFLFLKLYYNKIKVCDLCEIPYHDHFGIKKIKKRRIREKYVFPLFDAFVVISENLHLYIKEKTRNKASIIKVPILYQPIQPFIAKTNSPLPFFIHSGSLTESKDGIVSMLTAFGKAKNELNIPFYFYITGYLDNSPDKRNILAVIEKYNLHDSVFFNGFVSKAELLSLQLGASLAIINKADNEMNNYNFPTKLSEYLNNQIAVIASEIGELKNYLTNNENVYFYKPNDMEGLVNCIKDAMTDKQKREQIALNGRKLAEENFSHTIQGKRLYLFFEKLIKS